MTFIVNFSNLLETINQITTAGVAITAIALMMYALGFNFKDRMAQAFALILLAVIVIYTGEIIAQIYHSPAVIQFWLQLKWVGLVMLPVFYLHFSDALLTLVGRPSRGRRRLTVQIVYVVSLIGVVGIWLGYTVGNLAPTIAPVPYLERTTFTFLFGIYYIIVMLMTSYNLARVIMRSVTATSRRRFMYLFAGASAPAITAIIFLFHGNQFFASSPIFFWLVSIAGAVITDLFLIVMAYTVSFFGVSWTDRAIKSRLFRWLLRGPFVAGVVLALTTIARRYGESLGDPYIAYVPIVMLGSILVLEYVITIFAPKIEKALFFGADREDLSMLQMLENRMLTRKDLDQFLETIAASICDRLQVSGAFIAVLDGNEIDYLVQAGDKRVLMEVPLTEEVLEKAMQSNGDGQRMFKWGSVSLLPLEYKLDQETGRLLGLCGFSDEDGQALSEENLQAVLMLAERATMAIRDRILQQQAIRSISVIQPEIDYIQDLRGSATLIQNKILTPEKPEMSAKMTEYVRDALTHYWGGPKLTNNPLLDLEVVKVASSKQEVGLTNALRTVLKNAIERTRPLGERKFTGDWLLYNILDLKFLQGQKVRDVAQKLSVSEADLYRKQRVALENVARTLAQMEEELTHETPSPTVQNLS